MSENPYRDRLEKLIRAEFEVRALQVTQGASQTFDDYKHEVGYLAGLRAAIDLCAQAQIEERETEE